MNEAAWQPDPTNRHELRWWDGTAWTDHVSDQGVVGVDPLVAPPAQPFPGATAPQWGAPAAQMPSAPMPSGPPPIIEQVPGPDTPVYIPPTEPTTTYPQVAPTYSSTVLGAGPIPPQKKNRLPLIIGAVVVLAGLGAGAFFLLKGDDDKGGTLGSDTTATVTQPTTDGTTAPTELTTPSTDGVDTTSAPETTEATETTEARPTIVSEQLRAALETATDAPADWVAATGDVPLAEPSETAGYCNEANDVLRAQQFGSTGEAWGPAYVTPVGGRISVDAFAFPTEQAAADFLQATGGQINVCGAPTQYSADESLIDALPDPLGDTSTWTLTEHAFAEFVDTADADELLTISSNDDATNTVDGTNYTFVFTFQHMYERHGNVVLAFTLNGLHDFTGEANPSWAYNPQQADVAAAAAALRPSILARLQGSGLI